jgi:hypothetical protein
VIARLKNALLGNSLQFDAFNFKYFDELLHVWHSVTLKFTKNKSAVDLDFECSGLNKTRLDHIANNETCNSIHDFAFLNLLNEVWGADSDGLAKGVAHH